MSFFKKMQEGAAKAAEKAKETIEINRLHAQISSKRKEVDMVCQKIGESIYQSYQGGDMSKAEASVLAMCAQIDQLHQEIVSIEGKIKDVKNEKDCVCGRTVPVETRFCSSCGHKFEPEAQVQDEEAAEIEPETEAGIAIECVVCHAELEPEAQFCGNCGAPASAPPVSQ